MKLGKYIRGLRNSYRENKKTFVFYTILRVMVILTFVRCMFQHNYQSAALCVLSLILFLIPAFVQDKMRLSIPNPWRGEPLLCADSGLGYDAAHHERIPVRGNWVFDDLSVEPWKQQCESVAFLSDDGRVLLFDDDRCFVGIFRIFNGSVFLPGYAEGLCRAGVWFRDA